MVSANISPQNVNRVNVFAIYLFDNNVNCGKITF